ncbi:MAG: hypothetical protein FJW86_03440 [Actinobacteria bacterium]|nr:hypothetical protein [Actinomycetota bacterium]
MTSAGGSTGSYSSYDLAAWSEDQRLDLAFLLQELRVPFQWDGSTPLVPPRAAEVAEQQIACLTRRAGIFLGGLRWRTKSLAPAMFRMRHTT